MQIGGNRPSRQTTTRFPSRQTVNAWCNAVMARVLVNGSAGAQEATLDRFQGALGRHCTRVPHAAWSGPSGTSQTIPRNAATYSPESVSNRWTRWQAKATTRTPGEKVGP